MEDTRPSENPSAADPNAWGTDRDLWGLDMFMAVHAEPVASGPRYWRRSGDEPAGSVEVGDREQLTAAIAALGSGEEATAWREDARVRVVNVARHGQPLLLILEFPAAAGGHENLRIFHGLRDSTYFAAPVTDHGYRELETFDPERAATITWSALSTGLPVGYYSTPVAPG